MCGREASSMMSLRKARVGLAVVAMTAPLAVFGGMPAQAMVPTCKVVAENPHESVHYPGTANAVISVNCGTYDPPGYLYVDGAVEIWNGSYWADAGWSSRLLDDKATLVRKSFSTSCYNISGFAKYRSRARYGVGPSKAEAMWYSWKYSQETSGFCASGGGGGDGWSLPKDLSVE